MKYLLLSGDKYVIVDDEDFDWASKCKWTYDAMGYAHRKVGGRKNSKKIYLHRVILHVKEKQKVDHINGNHYDCQKKNLRVATSLQNQRNMKLRKDSESGYKGVRFKRDMVRKKPWEAYIRLDKKRKTLGHYTSAVEAASAYNVAAEKFFGEFARINQI